jgi:aromatic-L-amino-acid/L-tryptophan decarboxylase
VNREVLHRSAPLEPSADEVRELGDQALDYVAAFTAGRRDAPASDFDGIEPLLERVRVPPPETGTPLAELLELIALASRKGHDTTGDGWLAYVPGGGLYSSALGEFIARATNRFVGVWEAAPVMAELEASVIRWLAGLFDLPATARGFLTTGGSMATLSAVVVARNHVLGDDLAAGTMYITSETHTASTKAAILAGIKPANVRLVPTTDRLRMDVAELERMIEEDRASGRKPFLVVASAGTTNTGAVDPIAAIGAVTRREGLWFHVDAAYGGFFALTQRGRSAFGGIEQAHSIVLDPHKGLFLPYGTGALLVRDGAALRVAHEIHGPFLHDLAPEGDIPNFSDYSPELSRDARGLRVWLPLMLHGIAAFRGALDEKLDLTAWLDTELGRLPGIEVPWRPELSVVCFRAIDPDPDRADRRTAALLDRINESQRVFLSSTMVEGRLTIRVCILSVYTHRDRIEELVRIVTRLLPDDGSPPASPAVGRRARGPASEPTPRARRRPLGGR